MREEFSALVSGWTLISGRAAISERLEELAPWIAANQPLLPDEEATVRMMIGCEIARGIDEGARKRWR